MKIGRWLLMGATLLFPAQMSAQGPPSPAEMEAERAAQRPRHAGRLTVELQIQALTPAIGPL